MFVSSLFDLSNLDLYFLKKEDVLKKVLKTIAGIKHWNLRRIIQELQQRVKNLQLALPNQKPRYRPKKERLQSKSSLPEVANKL